MTCTHALILSHRTFGCGLGLPGVYARVSDGFEWLRWIVCQDSSAPRPAYLDCATSTDPNIGPTPLPPTPPNPIDFQYTLQTDLFFHESGKCFNIQQRWASAFGFLTFVATVGVIIERINGLTTQVVDYVVPSALPSETLYTSSLQLETSALYSFGIVDALNDGIETDDDVCTY